MFCYVIYAIERKHSVNIAVRVRGTAVFSTSYFSCILIYVNGTSLIHISCVMCYGTFSLICFQYQRDLQQQMLRLLCPRNHIPDHTVRCQDKKRKNMPAYDFFFENKCKLVLLFLTMSLENSSTGTIMMVIDIYHAVLNQVYD